MRYYFVLFLVLAAAPAFAQSKFFSTPSRGGAEGAKQSAQVVTLQGENERMNTCTAAGRIYAPTHPNKDANDCIPHMLLNPTNGQATFTNGVTVNSGGVNVTGNSTFGNNLTVTGTSTFSANMNVNARVTANQLYVGSGNVGSIPTCTNAQKLQWNGTAWTCVADNIGATAATEVDPKVGTLTNGRWCRTNGSQVICDVNVPVACGNAQKLQWNGSAWSCIAEQGITSENDPRVGAVTSGKWCRGNGSQVICDQNPPSGSTTTTTGSCVNCNSVCSCGGVLTSCSTCSCYSCSGGDDDNGDW